MNAAYETNLVVRATDANGDMIIGIGDSVLITGREAMSQVIRTRLAAGNGEWWEGDAGAIPWHTDVIGAMLRENRLRELDLMVVNRIMDTVGVTGVDDVRSSIANRTYHFSCTVHTVYGDVTAEVTT